MGKVEHRKEKGTGDVFLSHGFSISPRFDTKCDKCGAEQSDHALGDKMQYHLCEKCLNAWQRFHNRKDNAELLDKVYRTKGWKAVWETVYNEFLGKGTRKEKVEFT